jgi:hypothetical protein
MHQFSLFNEHKEKQKAMQFKFHAPWWVWSFRNELFRFKALHGEVQLGFHLAKHDQTPDESVLMFQPTSRWLLDFSSSFTAKHSPSDNNLFTAKQLLTLSVKLTGTCEKILRFVCREKSAQKRDIGLWSQMRSGMRCDAMLGGMINLLILFPVHVSLTCFSSKTQWSGLCDVSKAQQCSFSMRLQGFL